MWLVTTLSIVQINLWMCDHYLMLLTNNAFWFWIINLPSMQALPNPNFGKHGAKQYTHGKPIKFGFKFWVVATPLWYCIQFRPYAVKDSILQEYENIRLGLGASVVANWVSKLLMMQASNYHIVMDNYFTSPAFLRNLSAMGVPATGTVRANQMENAPFRYKVKMNKEKRRS